MKGEKRDIDMIQTLNRVKKKWRRESAPHAESQFIARKSPIMYSFQIDYIQSFWEIATTWPRGLSAGLYMPWLKHDEQKHIRAN